MMNAILLSATEARINTAKGWILSIITGLLILRAINDFMRAYNDPDMEMGLKEAWRKCKNRIYAAIIAITIDSLVVYFEFFY